MGIAPANLAMTKAVDPVAVLPSVGTLFTLVASGKGAQEERNRPEKDQSMRSAHSGLPWKY
jgi:hypothetical protein